MNSSSTRSLNKEARLQSTVSSVSQHFHSFIHIQSISISQPTSQSVIRIQSLTITYRYNSIEHYLVNLIRRDTRFDLPTAQIQNVPRQFTRRSHFFNLFVRFDLDNPRQQRFTGGARNAGIGVIRSRNLFVEHLMLRCLCARTNVAGVGELGASEIPKLASESGRSGSSLLLGTTTTTTLLLVHV